MGRTLVSRHDSPLGQWTRAIYFPDQPLASSVEMMWFVAGRTQFARDRRLPEGKPHLLFNLGDAPTLFARESGRGARKFPTCWVSGQQQSFIETGAEGAAILLGAQFRSHGAYRALRVPQHELADNVVELESVLGDRVLRVRERLLHAASPHACFELLEHWLLGLLARGRAVHPAVTAASRVLERDASGMRLTQLSKELGVSREHLIRLFREQVGLPPKAYANILRFNRTLALARTRRAAWSDIAQAGGYYDQAHLVRDFQRYAGRTPTSLLRDRMPDDASIVVI
jgi:AraC-like DNA-binding protein